MEDRPITAVSHIESLLDIIDHSSDLVVQTHDFPDHDAVAAGFALQQLLSAYDISVGLCYGGEMQSASLEAMIDRLSIPLVRAEEAGLTKDTQIIVVDGFVGNANMSGIEGEVIGVIDHHVPPNRPANTRFADIRPEYGSCSTILYEYLLEANVELTHDVATALLMGLMLDTGFMTRGVSQADFEAFRGLFFAGDYQMGSYLLRNSLSLADLEVFGEAIRVSKVAGDFCFVPLQMTCSPEVSALVADFFLGLREIAVVAVSTPTSGGFRVSVRSEDIGRPADELVRKVLDQIGTGGGHVHMAGAFVTTGRHPGDQALFDRFERSVKPNLE